MPYAHNQGVRIHYQTEGLAHHWSSNMGSPTVWRAGTNWGMSQRCRTRIGSFWWMRGDTAPATNPMTPQPMRTSTRSRIASPCWMPSPSRRRTFWATMGGRIGFALATYAPARFSSLLIGGATPHAVNCERFNAQLQMLKQGPESIVALWGKGVSPALQARLRANDAAAMVASWRGGIGGAGLEEVLPTMHMPCLLFVGDADVAYAGVKEFVTHMPNVTFVSLPGLKHAETFFHSELVLPHVMTFLARMVH